MASSDLIDSLPTLRVRNFQTLSPFQQSMVSQPPSVVIEPSLSEGKLGVLLDARNYFQNLEKQGTKVSRSDNWIFAVWMRRNNELIQTEGGSSRRKLFGGTYYLINNLRETAEWCEVSWKLNRQHSLERVRSIEKLTLWIPSHFETGLMNWDQVPEQLL